MPAPPGLSTYLAQTAAASAPLTRRSPAPQAPWPRPSRAPRLSQRLPPQRDLAPAICPSIQLTADQIVIAGVWVVPRAVAMSPFLTWTRRTRTRPRTQQPPGWGAGSGRKMLLLLFRGRASASRVSALSGHAAGVSPGPGVPATLGCRACMSRWGPSVPRARGLDMETAADAIHLHLVKALVPLPRHRLASDLGPRGAGKRSGLMPKWHQASGVPRGSPGPVVGRGWG